MSRSMRRRLAALDSNKNAVLDDDITFTGAITFSGVVALSSFTLGGTAIGATAAEINRMADVSAYRETIAAAGALSISAKISKLALVGAGAVTLAAPDLTVDGYKKVITMTADNGDVTLALTNVTGQSSGTTATFNDVGDFMEFTADGSNGKWVVTKEKGVTLS